MSISQFDIGQLLGRGGFASVYQARRRSDGLEVAIKIMLKSTIKQIGVERVVNEIKTHRKLKHEAIVSMFDYFEDDNNIYMILELCRYGNFFQYLRNNGPMSENQTKNVMRQIMSCLEYMHSHGIIHRDLKLSNILISDCYIDPTFINSQDNSISELQFTIKICDFGLATQIDHPDEEHYTLCGTPNYIAPEIASQQVHGHPADIWSAGCLFYSMIEGALPFDQGDVKLTLQKIMSGEYSPPAHISPTALEFMNRLLDMNPWRRPSAKDMLKHPFLLTHQQIHGNDTRGLKNSAVPAVQLQKNGDPFDMPATVDSKSINYFNTVSPTSTSVKVTNSTVSPISTAVTSAITTVTPSSKHFTSTDSHEDENSVYVTRRASNLVHSSRNQSEMSRVITLPFRYELQTQSQTQSEVATKTTDKNSKICRRFTAENDNAITMDISRESPLTDQETYTEDSYNISSEKHDKAAAFKLSPQQNIRKQYEYDNDKQYQNTYMSNSSLGMSPPRTVDTFTRRATSNQSPSQTISNRPSQKVNLSEPKFSPVSKDIISSSANHNTATFAVATSSNYNRTNRDSKLSPYIDNQTNYSIKYKSNFPTHEVNYQSQQHHCDPITDEIDEMNSNMSWLLNIQNARKSMSGPANGNNNSQRNSTRQNEPSQIASTTAQSTQRRMNSHSNSLPIHNYLTNKTPPSTYQNFESTHDTRVPREPECSYNRSEHAPSSGAYTERVVARASEVGDSVSSSLASLPVWVDAAAGMGAFSYCYYLPKINLASAVSQLSQPSQSHCTESKQAPSSSALQSVDAEFILVSSLGDVTAVTTLMDKSGRSHRCRLNMVANHPFELRLGRLTENMRKECNAIIQKRHNLRPSYTESNDRLKSQSQSVQNSKLASMVNRSNSTLSRQQCQVNPLSRSLAFDQDLSVQNYNRSTDNANSELDNVDSDDNDSHKHIHTDLIHNSNEDYKLMKSLAIFQDSNWVKKFSVRNLPRALLTTYLRTYKILDAVRSRVPRIILYVLGSSAVPTDTEDTRISLPSKSSNVSRNNHPYSIRKQSLHTEAIPEHRSIQCTNTQLHEEPQSQGCKCLLMCNGPLPDFCVQWLDGAKLRYSLRTGIVCIDYPDNSNRPQSNKDPPSGMPNHSSSSGSGNAETSSTYPLPLFGHWEGPLMSSAAFTSSSHTWNNSGQRPINNTSVDTSDSSTNSAADLLWRHPPKAVRMYLRLAQQALHRCLHEERSLLQSNSAIGSPSSLQRGQIKPHIICCHHL